MFSNSGTKVESTNANASRAWVAPQLKKITVEEITAGGSEPDAGDGKSQKS